MPHNISIQNLLILRPDNLGDLVLFSGTLHFIRKMYQKANITLFVKKSNYNLFSLCPYIDRLVEWERLSSLPFHWLPEIRGKYRLNQFGRHIFNMRYRSDVLLLPVRSPTDDIFGMHDIVSSIPANEKIGISGDYCNQTVEEDNKADRIYTKRLRLKKQQQSVHELEINRDFLNFLGVTVKTTDIWPEFWTDKKDLEWAETHIANDEKTITLAICPGVTSNSGKYYPGEKYAQAINSLKDIKFCIVLFGSPDERSMCQEVAKALAECGNIESITDLSGQSSVRQLIEALKLCDIVLSIDTAPLHIAVALKKPTVGIMGGGHFGRFYPWGDEKINRVANKPMDCYWCNWNCTYPTMRCIQEIEPETIAHEIRTALYEAGLR